MVDAVFFSQFMVNKKGPLSRVWLAAHWDKKLTKAHIFEISIERSVEGILQPKVKMALRTTGHLLLGVVRIYSRKAKYLLADCNEAFVKIKMAFRPGMVDLPEGNREASLAAITLPEVFHDFENMGDMTIEVETPNTRNQCRAEEITIKEDYGTLSLMTDDAFGDLAFNDPDIANDATNIDEAFDHTGLIIVAEPPEASNEKEQQEDQEPAVAENKIEVEEKDKEAASDTSATVGCEFFGTGLFDDAPIGPVPADTQPTSSEPGVQQKNIDASDDDFYGDFGPASVGLPSGPSSPGSIAPDNLAEDVGGIISVPEPQKSQTPMVEDNSAVSANQTTLIQNDSEAFALAPLDATVYRGMERGRSKRKRKLIVDEVKNISGEEMKNQLSDTRDIITTLDLAPPTKRLMHWKETGGVEKLFALPGHVISSKVLSRLYMRHLTTRPMDEESDTDIDAEGSYLEMEVGRASKKQRLEEPSQSEAVYPEQLPLEISQSKQPIEEASTISVPEAGNLTIDKEAEFSAPKLPEVEADKSLTLPMGNISSLLPIPEEIQDVEKIVVGVQVEVVEKAAEAKKDDTANDLFDTLTANVVIAAPTEASAAANSEELPDSEAEKADQNNILPLDDDDDVGGPASVGPPEEQLADETDEQFEERVHSKRASVMLHILKRNLDAGYTIPFSAVVRGNKRKQVAQKFYTLLVLKKQQMIEMEQSKAYEEVYVSRGPQYDDLFA